MSKYFSQPQNWNFIQRGEYMQTLQKIEFFKLAISEVKKRLGKNCKFLSHLVTDGKVKFLAKIKPAKSKEFINIRVDSGKTDVNELVAEDYKNLKGLLDEYIRGTKAL